MKNNKISIGGEKYFTLSLLFSKKQNDIFNEYEREFKDYSIQYTFGGYYSLLAIIDDLNLGKNNECILLPSYLCDSILRPFDVRGVKYEFYKVDSNLTPDFDHITELIRSEVKAILFIDYMGLSLSKWISPFIKLFSFHGIKIIQDCVQTIQLDATQKYGDYIFNSFRKFTPFEGSVLISKTKMNINYSKNKNSSFIFYKRLGQIFRYLHIKGNIFGPRIFLSLFKISERIYQKTIVLKMPTLNRYLIEKLNLTALMNQHKNYFVQLEILYSKYLPVSFHEKNFIPFGFVLITKNRDQLRSLLASSGIYCPVHWLLPKKIDFNNHKTSFLLSNYELTIPLSDLDDISFNVLKNILNKLKEETF